MTIVAALLIFSSTSLAVENVTPFCRFDSEPVVHDQYIVQTPKGVCEIVSFDVLTGRECKKFVKAKSLETCYQLGKIYDTSVPKQKPYTACFSCKPNRR